MSSTFDTIVEEQGPALWRIGGEQRKRFHEGSRCAGRSWLLGGRGCTHACESWLEDALLQVAHSEGVWRWGPSPSGASTSPEVGDVRTVVTNEGTLS